MMVRTTQICSLAPSIDEKMFLKQKKEALVKQQKSRKEAEKQKKMFFVGRLSKHKGHIK